MTFSRVSRDILWLGQFSFRQIERADDVSEIGRQRGMGKRLRDLTEVVSEWFERQSGLSYSFRLNSSLSSQRRMNKSVLLRTIKSIHISNTRACIQSSTYWPIQRPALTRALSISSFLHHQPGFVPKKPHKIGYMGDNIVK